MLFSPSVFLLRKNPPPSSEGGFKRRGFWIVRVGTGVLDGPRADDTVKRTAREGGPYEENLDGAAMRFVGKGFIPSVELC